MSLQLGTIFVTPGVVDEIDRDEIYKALSRHQRYDWGNVCEEDWEANDKAVKNNSRILSSYTSKDNVDFWIITESDRISTTIMLPEEY